MSKNKRFHRVLADKWPIILAVLIFVAFTFAGCQQFFKQAPIAVISASKTDCAPNTSITFDGSSSYDPDGGSIASWEWDFDDGTATGVTQTHSYSSEGEYTVTLTVTDDEGSTGTATVTINVRMAPTAIAKADPKEGEPPLTVNFDGSDSYDDNGTIVKFEWDFEGDGTFDCTTDDTSGCGTGDDQQPTHTYESSGIFKAVLRVTDNDGYTDSDTVTITTLAAHIYFGTDRDGNYNIYRMDTDGNNLNRVTDETDMEAFPALLATTRLELAYASAQTAGADWDIYTSEYDGTLRSTLTESQTTSDEVQPSWDDDGTEIAYASNDGTNWEIFTMNADGSGSPDNLTNQTPYNEFAPVFSPDGSKILYVSDEDGDQDLFTMDPDGTDEKRIYDTDGNKDEGIYVTFVPFHPGSTPSWSPDGEYIAYAGEETAGGDVDIYICDYDSTDNECDNVDAVDVASDDSYDEFDPFWSPDGEWIFYVRDTTGTGGGNYEIRKFKIDTSSWEPTYSNEQQVLNSGNNNITPADEPWNN